jgi:hypothetical protein
MCISFVVFSVAFAVENLITVSPLLLNSNIQVIMKVINISLINIALQPLI